MKGVAHYDILSGGELFLTRHWPAADAERNFINGIEVSAANILKFAGKYYYITREIEEETRLMMIDAEARYIKARNDVIMLQDFLSQQSRSNFDVVLNSILKGYR